MRDSMISEMRLLIGGSAFGQSHDAASACDGESSLQANVAEIPMIIPVTTCNTVFTLDSPMVAMTRRFAMR